MRLSGEAYSIAGVMPANFRFPINAPLNSFWITLAHDNDGTPKAQTANRGDHEMGVIGLMKPGVTVAQANADMSAIAARLTKQYPDTNTKLNSARVTSELTAVLGDTRALLAGHSGSGRPGASDRMRECRELVAGKGTRAPARDGNAGRSGRKPRPPGSPTARREPDDWLAWRRGRMCAGVCSDAGGPSSHWRQCAACSRCWSQFSRAGIRADDLACVQSDIWACACHHCGAR